MDVEARLRQVLGHELDKMQLGKEVADLLDSKIGRYLLDRAEQDQQSAYQEFKDADIEDAKAIRNLQKKVNAPGVAIAWLMDAIQEGEVARKLIEEELANEEGE
jgi:hypothetical protein